MFVRTKRVGTREYRQLVQNYRDENGRHRQRVVVHLGQHDSLEAALAAARRKLAELEASKKRGREAERRRRRLRERVERLETVQLEINPRALTKPRVEGPVRWAHDRSQKLSEPRW